MKPCSSTREIHIVDFYVFDSSFLIAVLIISSFDWRFEFRTYFWISVNSQSFGRTKTLSVSTLASSSRMTQSEMLTLLASDRALDALDACLGFGVSVGLDDWAGFEGCEIVDFGGSTNLGLGVSAGFETGLETGWEAGLETGWEAGLETGFEAGIDVGFGA